MLVRRKCVIDSISYLLKQFPCVIILGARQVGKSTIAKQLFANSPYFDLEKSADQERIARDPDFFLSSFKEPIVIDEAQLLPSLFPALRVAIDSERNTNGQFLITGSSSPELLKNVTESLAGRAAIFELEGFTLEEAWELPPSPFYETINKQEVDSFLDFQPRLSAEQLFESCIAGSYPEAFRKGRTDPKYLSLWMESYIKTYIDRDIRRLFPGLDLTTFQRFISMLSRSSGQIINAAEFARSLGVSQPTIRSYIHIAVGTFIWRTMPVFTKDAHVQTTKLPKGNLRDSGISNYILENRSLAQLHSHPLVGRLWESFISEEIIKGFRNRLIRIEPYFYRTRGNAEIDLILEGDFGVLPIEIKLGTKTDTRDLRAIQDFVTDRKLKFGLVINNANRVEWLTKEILQFPANFL